MDLTTLKDMPSWEWPDDAAKNILDVLRNRKAEEAERLLAAELAAELSVMDDAMASALLAVVRDSKEPEELRCVAAAALGPVLEYTDTVDYDDPDEVLISKKTFRKIQKSLQELFREAGAPEELRRRALEASAGSPLDWHTEALRTAYTGDRLWVGTAVFCMQYVPGFEEEILEALGSSDPDVHYWAVCAAGNWELDAAWDHIAGIVTAAAPEKELLLAAIESAGTIRPHLAHELLDPLRESEDEDIAATVEEALIMADELTADAEDEAEAEDEDLPF